MARSRLVALLTVLALLAPASAFAQSAGDEQYQDPFGGDSQDQSSGQGTSSGGDAGTTVQASPTPAPSSAPVATAAQQPAAAAQQLPRTGGDPVTPAVAGFWLLLGGITLRVRLRPR